MSRYSRQTLVYRTDNIEFLKLKKYSNKNELWTLFQTSDLDVKHLIEKIGKTINKKKKATLLVQFGKTCFCYRSVCVDKVLTSQVNY